MEERFYFNFAIAAIRGNIIRSARKTTLSHDALTKDLLNLTSQEIDEILNEAKKNEIKLHYFKRSDRTLPRVHKVIGFLKGISFDSLVDVGSGRGVFLLPFLSEFEDVKVTAMDLLDKRVALLSDISAGGIERLTVLKADICDAPLSEKSADVVTMLEVLEHIPDVRAAIRNAVRIARKYIVLTVPSKEDDNPEHIHLLTKAKLTEYFNECGVTRLHFDGVPGHLFMIGSLD